MQKLFFIAKLYYCNVFHCRRFMQTAFSIYNLTRIVVGISHVTVNLFLDEYLVVGCTFHCVCGLTRNVLTKCMRYKQLIQSRLTLQQPDDSGRWKLWRPHVGFGTCLCSRRHCHCQALLSPLLWTCSPKPERYSGSRREAEVDGAFS